MKKIHSSLLPAVVVGIASVLASGIASAAPDNVFVTDNGSDSVMEIVDGTPSVFIPSNSGDLLGPTGVAIFGNDLYVANNGSGVIAEFNLTTKSFVGDYVTGLFNPRGVVFDSAGNLYVANQSSGNIIEVPAGSPLGSTGSVFASGLSFPNGLAIADGSLYAANGATNTIDQISLATGVVTTPTFITGLSNPNGVATKGGNVFVTNNGTSQVLEFDSNGVFQGIAVTTDPSNLIDSKGLAIDSEGDFWVTDEQGNGEVTEYDKNGNLIATFSTGFSGPNFITTQPNVSVPEPSTYALLVASLGMLFVMCRRKKVTV
jgi:sugar lactone lactonase YvrE